MSCVEGTWGWEFAAGFGPLPGELVIRKHRPSAFVATDLEQLLRVAGVETVLVAGCVTEGCVQSTAVDALFRDFYTVVIEDCVATFQESLHNDGISYLKRRVAIGSATIVREGLASSRPDGSVAPR
jgi:nicotinamidase-related amidase